MQKIPHVTPETVYALYTRDVMINGARGAYARVGRAVGKSDETVRRWVHQAEARLQVDDALVYVPPPGGYPVPEPMPQVAQELPQIAPNPPKTASPDAPGRVHLPSPGLQPGDDRLRRCTAPVPQPLQRPVSCGNRPPPTVPWWSTIEVHPQVIAVVVAVLLVLVSFPH